MRPDYLQDRRDELVDGFASALNTVEALLKQAGKASRGRTEELRSDAEDQLRQARRQLRDYRSDATDRATRLADSGDQYVRNNAWISIGVAAAVGLLAGVALGRRPTGSAPPADRAQDDPASVE